MLRSVGSESKVGACESSIVIICVAVAWLPQLSVAVQVRINTLLLSHDPSDVLSSNTTSTSVSQLSVAGIVAGASGIASQLTVMSFGVSPNTGNTVSSILII